MLNKHFDIRKPINKMSLREYNESRTRSGETLTGKEFRKLKRKSK